MLKSLLEPVDTKFEGVVQTFERNLSKSVKKLFFGLFFFSIYLKFDQNCLYKV